MERYVNAGVALVVAVIMAIVGTSVAATADYDQVYAVDTQSEWDNGTFTSTTSFADGYVALNGTATTGTYDSVTISNETNRVEVYADIESPDNSSVSMDLGTETYNLSDGRNVFSLDSSVTDYSFTLNFDRDADTVTSPEVHTYQAYFGEDGLTSLIAGAAFALLILFGVMSLVGRQQ